MKVFFAASPIPTLRALSATAVACMTIAAFVLAACGSDGGDPSPAGDGSGAGGVSSSPGAGGARGEQDEDRDAGAAGGAAGGAAAVGGQGGHNASGGANGQAGAGGGPPAAGGQAGQPVVPAAFVQTFDELTTGGAWLSSCKWKKHARVTEGCGVARSKCLRIAQDPTNKEPSLYPLPPIDERPPYPAGSNGVCEPYYTNTATDVVQAVQPIEPLLEATLSYDIFFEEGFDWARGGKLPGLAAKEWDSGCSVEGDGLATDPGPARWSVRLMWRTMGTNELYVYDQDRAAGACGTRAPSPTPFATGRWHSVSVYVKLNTTAAAKDGVAQMYLDGARVRDEQGLRLRASDTKASRITNIFFSTFYGGNEAKRLYCLTNPNAAPCKPADPKVQVTWAPARPGYIRFDNVAVYPGLQVRHEPGAP